MKCRAHTKLTMCNFPSDPLWVSSVFDVKSRLSVRGYEPHQPSHQVLLILFPLSLEHNTSINILLLGEQDSKLAKIYLLKGFISFVKG